jgi:hypothetical protein
MGPSDAGDAAGGSWIVLSVRANTGRFTAIKEGRSTRRKAKQ